MRNDRLHEEQEIKIGSRAHYLAWCLENPSPPPPPLVLSCGTVLKNPERAALKLDDEQRRFLVAAAIELARWAVLSERQLWEAKESARNDNARCFFVAPTAGEGGGA